MIFLSPAFSVLTQTRRVFLWHSTTYIEVKYTCTWCHVYLQNIINQCFVMVIMKFNPFHLLRYISIHKNTRISQHFKHIQCQTMSISDISSTSILKLNVSIRSYTFQWCFYYNFFPNYKLHLQCDLDQNMICWLSV